MIIIHGTHGEHGCQLKIILKIFVQIYTIGYFCRDSAKNKFLDLFSALTAPKIRAVRRSPLKFFPKSEVLERILFRILVKDYSFLVIELFLAKQHLKQDFPKRFLAFRLPKKIHGSHGGHGERFSLKILFCVTGVTVDS